MAAAWHVALAWNDLPAGAMRPVRVAGVDLLLIRTGERVDALAARCPHYQMPLADGLLCGGTLRCSWHQSLFEVSTGQVLQPPALQAVPHYAARVEDGQIWVCLRAEDAPGSPPATGAGASIVLLGGGAASMAAALELRQRGFAGSLRMITAERHRPYDRPNLSKEYLSGIVPAADLPLVSHKQWAALEISLLHRRAVAVDLERRRVCFADRSSTKYDRLLLATGSVAKPLQVPGAGIAGVLSLRSLADAQHLFRAARAARRAVVVGSSFVGMEAAGALRERGLAVTVVTRDAAPFQRVLGQAVGRYFQRIHSEAGVRFRFRSGVRRVIGRGRISAVQLANGEVLPADLLLAAVGPAPATGFLPERLLNEHRRVPVDATFRAVGGDGSVFAAGDVAEYPAPRTGQPMHVEHWRVAEQQGRLAARNMLASLVADRPLEPFQAVPYFWSYQLGQGLDYVGHAQGWDEIFFDGEVRSGDFAAYYRQGGHIAATASAGRSLQMAALLEWISRHGPPTIEQVKARPDWAALMRADC